jgi:hypothetical protein
VLASVLNPRAYFTCKLDLYEIPLSEHASFPADRL